MPEAPQQKVHRHPHKRANAACARPDDTAHSPAAVPYAELHCLSNFSFLRGASHPEELVEQAANLGYTALALTDRNSLAGVVRAHLAAREIGLHLIIGAEITPTNAPPLVLLAPDRPAYARLARLITRGRLRTPKGACAITLSDIAELGTGLIALLVPPRPNPPAEDAAPAPFPPSAATLATLRATFGQQLYLAATLAYDVSDEVRLAQLDELAADMDLPLVATNAVHYHVPERRYLQDVLTCIRATCTLSAAGRRLFANAERHLRPRRDIAERYAGYEAAVARTVAIARQCTFRLDELRYEYPHELCPPGKEPMDYLEELVRRGANRPPAQGGLQGGISGFPSRAGTSGCPSQEDASDSFYQKATQRASPARTPTLPPPGRGRGKEPSQKESKPPPSFPGGDPNHPPPSQGGVRGGSSPGSATRLQEALDRELALIRELRYEHYFLTVWDLVRFARRRGILCQGRGSAANSVVCYCLGVTAVDPRKIDLLFERFISRERNEPPDIDIDFEHERREEVFEYIYEKYGRERAAITAEVITYRPRSAVRDVGKALGLSLDKVDVLAKALEWWSDEALPEDTIKAAGLDPNDRTIQMLVRLVRQILGFPRHLSQHVGGFVITETPLCEIVPLENGAMPGRTFIEWDKDDIDALGILKVDCLALGMLTALSKCFAMLADWKKHVALVFNSVAPAYDRRVASALRGRRRKAEALDPERTDGRAGARPLPVNTRPLPSASNPLRTEQWHAATPRSTNAPLAEQWHTGPPLPESLLDIPPEDPAVYDMICAADTVGVFQIESRAQMSMLPRLRPRNFYDLVIEVAIVRPGPIQGGMVHPYLRRRRGEERVSYPSEAVREVLEKTLGVPLFQEQVMRVAMVAAGFSPGEADQLRRAMAAWRRHGSLDKFRLKLMRGMLANGYDQDFAGRLYQQIRGFGEYGFPESHAASFALLVYASAWLKCYHPAAFCGALINAQPMGFYSPGQLVRDAQAHGVEVRPIDVNASDWDCTLEAREAETSDPEKADGQAGAWPLPRAPKPLLTEQWHGVASPPEKPLLTARWHQAPALRLGMRLVRGLSPAKVAGIVAARQAGPIRSLRQLARRSDVSRETLVRLAAADAFRSLGLSRRAALWHILSIDDREPPLFAEFEPDASAVELPPLMLEEVVREDYDAIGFSLSAHPIGLLRRELHALRARTNEQLRTVSNGTPVRVAGLVTVRQRPSTARGIVFMTLEDETGNANLVMHPPIWRRDRQTAGNKLALLVDGHVERQGEVVHVIVRKVQDLTKRLKQLNHRSRDFR